MIARQLNPGRLAWIALSMCLGMGPLLAGCAEQESASTAQPGGGTAASTLTNIISIMRLPREVAAQQLPVTVEGVVSCTYSGDSVFFIHDGQAGVYVGNTEALRHFSFGERVRVKGRSLHGAFCPMITAVEIESLGPGVVPPPRPASFASLAGGSAVSQWLEIQGVVQAVKLASRKTTAQVVIVGGISVLAAPIDLDPKTGFRYE